MYVVISIYNNDSFSFSLQYVINEVFILKIFY